MTFKFDKGITGIVGPNGSGKSNVADAVRWVLGEQSAKQLRGARMEDVIFSGTENRKPLGFAYVAIKFDNSDHQIGVDYDEVTVSRRVYRSGESEYKLNDAACRLRDIQELFMDTGIGKEGYSIIGQGQIDRILSGKPEERREIFDEAAGIVKFKKRKRAAEKNLEEEGRNLARVSDILSELERQVGPLEVQDAKAREYLKLRDELKIYDVNMYLSESDRLEKVISEVDVKEETVKGDLDATKQDFEKTKEEYDRLESEAESLNGRIEDKKNELHELMLKEEKNEGEINVLTEQIEAGDRMLRQGEERAKQLEDNIAAKEAEAEGLKAEKAELKEAGKALDGRKAEADKHRASLGETIENVKAEIEKQNAEIIENLGKEAQVKAKLGRYDTMLEQIGIRRAEVAGRLIALKSEDDEKGSTLTNFESEKERILEEVRKNNEEQDGIGKRLDTIRQELNGARDALTELQKEYHLVTSRYAALKNISDRYEGYVGSVRRIMEQKDRYTGIEGVIADLIKVEKKYETAVETSLGSAMQNIVTNNENTAKILIDFLKYNKYGRATFLPLTNIKSRGDVGQDILKEKGAIDKASNLVKCDAKYRELIEYLLGRILIADTIDNGLAIARKYKYSVRIVTLDGESLNTGGSMTGGAYKQNANLLSRARELEELSDRSDKIQKELRALSRKEEKLSNEKAEGKQRITELKQQLAELSILENTAKMNIEQAVSSRQEAREAYEMLVMEEDELKKQLKDIRSGKNEIAAELKSLEGARRQAEENLKALDIRLRESEDSEKSFAESTAGLMTEISVNEQKLGFTDANIDRIRSEIEGYRAEIESFKKAGIEAADARLERLAEIEEKKQKSGEFRTAAETVKTEIEDLTAERIRITEGNKDFFDKRDELSQRINDLDKELFRLNGQRERLTEQEKELSEYMYSEYEITRLDAQKMRDPELSQRSNTALKKAVNELRSSIKALGPVNVNAIEEYKQVKERYTLMKAQHADITEAREKLTGIIRTLEREMRAQFTKKFGEIQEQFDLVFKELFGGGSAQLSLVEEEDVLDAGVRIIATPPGKKLQNIMQMSGGEKALTAIALLFAIQRLKPSPFCLLDEIEAALDDANVKRFAQYLDNLAESIQFILITHRRGTMNAADVLYGITMQEKGVSTLVSVSLIDSKLDN